VEFRVLGPFEVRENGRTVDIGSPKHRVLLATLLLQPGRTVPVEALAEAIWDAGPPDNPRRVVQVYVARLRKLLASVAGEDIIVTDLDGYRMDVRPGQVDLGRFQQCLRRAREAARRGDLNEEAAALAAALAQWRGEPFVGVSSDRLRHEVVPRLREQRLHAVERRLEVDLRRGRHAESVGELQALTARYPLRERLWALLMEALYLGGRRAEALEVYQRARRRLADDVGLDPGEELRSLHTKVLDGRSRSAGSAVPPVPRQLPLDVPAFVGRAAELAKLDALLAGPGDPAATTVSVLSGTAGIGKTALAAHWARQVADHFPDGQLWANLRGHDPRAAVPSGPVLERFLRALGVRDVDLPRDLDEQAALYRSLMDGRRMLLLLDNAGSAEQVRPLLPGAPGSHVLITCRARLAGLVAAEGARPLTLDVLTPEESRRLLAARLGAHRLAAEPDAVAEMIRLCAGVPLALTRAAARAATDPGRPLHTVAAELPARRRGSDGARRPTRLDSG
jgi:DNA-binding SARP family transcriptional activator